MATADFIARMFWEVAREAGADARTEGGGWHGCKGGMAEQKTSSTIQYDTVPSS